MSIEVWGSTWDSGSRSNVSCQDWTEERMIDVFRSTELRKSKPKDNNSLEEVIESYGTYISIKPPRQLRMEGGTYATSTKLSLTSIRRGWRSQRPPSMSTIEYHPQSLHSQLLWYFHMLVISTVHESSCRGWGVTRENESHHVGEDLSSIVEENQEEVNESNAKSDKHLWHSRFLLKLNNRRILW